MHLPSLRVWSATVAAVATITTAHAEAPKDPSARPDDNRFTPVALTAPGTLDEPMVFQVLPDGRAFIAERKGTLKVYDPAAGGVKVAGALAVNTAGNYEQGLVGFTFDPGFAENNRVYLYYFHPTEAKAVFSRWEIRNDVLVANSEKVMMEWPAQRETCCHTGGGMTWDRDGNLLITVGNNRGNNGSAQTDERPGRAAWDDQGGTANSNSLEGKILRIHPEPDGTYTIPKGNLFPPGTPKTRPEIFSMGHRNVWRVSTDSATGYVYWGEVGPDNREDSEIGPRGYDEFNQARGPGFFGWPYFVADQAFPFWDYTTGRPMAKKDPLKPTNTSPNNTGLTELPPVAPPFIYYHGGVMEKFPALGSGGRCAIGGPIYHRTDFREPKRPWPPYFEGKWIIAEFSRRLILSVGMAPNGDFQSLERILPDYHPVEPIDLKFGPDGDLYVLEYGGRWFQASPDAKLVRIEFEAGNRRPVAVAATSKEGGVPPFEVTLSSAGTHDNDGDPLTYRWEVFGPDGAAPRVFTDPNPTVKFEVPGAHVARLTVTDPSGATDARSVPIVSGNEPPVVSVDLQGNQAFYLADTPFAYAVTVMDREDGSLASGRIPPERVNLSIDYVPEGFDLASLKTLPRGEAASARFPAAQALITKGNCKACHLVEGKLVGPSFSDVARKYVTDREAPARLAQKIVTGGGGVWSPLAMPPNALVNEAEAATILRYVLGLADPNAGTLPPAGRFTPRLPEGDAGRGSLIVRAIYTDQGEEQAPPLTGESIRVLRSPVLSAARADVAQHTEPGMMGVLAKRDAVLGFKAVDLTGVKQVEIAATALAPQSQTGGTVEIRLDSPAGNLLGSARVEPRDPFAGQRNGPAGPSGSRASAAAAPGSADPPPSGGTSPAKAVASAPAGPPAGGRPGAVAGGPRRAGGGAPGGAGGFNRPSIPGIPVDITDVTGRHDLYLIVKNDAAAEGASLMNLSSIRLRGAPAAPKNP
jgi:cytochrome c